MEQIILFEDSGYVNLLPFTFTRPSFSIRVGIFTIQEKWEARLHTNLSFFTRQYLSNKYPLQSGTDNLLVNGRVLPSQELIEQIQQLRYNEALVADENLIAVRLSADQMKSFHPDDFKDYIQQPLDADPLMISYPWDIFGMNGQAIQDDYEWLTSNRHSAPVSSTNNIIGDQLFVEEGVEMEYATINTRKGPVYIGSHTEIMEGSVIRGPFATCEHAQVKLSAKIYGPTTLGPYAKVGGEVNNSVIQGYSNKAHDGFIGNSVIGEWCNIGADSNNSNLKNNYKSVRVWNYASERFMDTGLQFCGLFMGDHSKCGINTMFNTGTVVGVSANIFGSGFPRTFIPSFSWGGASGFKTFSLPKAIEVAEQVMSRRDLHCDETEQNILKRVYDDTAQYRKV